MRQFTSLCSLCRHGVSSNPSNILASRLSPLRFSSSLSAIHRGLRESEKSRPQGFVRESLDTASSGRAKRVPSRVRRDPDWTPPGFSIKRGRKDVTDKGPRPKSRAERFHDPTESFGKKSLVYQAKHGQLREELENLRGDGLKTSGQTTFESKFAGKFNDDFGSRGPPKSQSRGDRRSAGSSKPRPRDPRLEYERAGSKFPTGRNERRPGRPAGFGRASDRGDSTMFDRAKDRSEDIEGFNPGRRGNSSFGDAPSREDARGPRRFDDRAPRFAGPPRDDARGPRRFDDRAPRFASPPRDDATSFRSSPSRDDLPIRIHHTTAASQFLYGRSVVEAALKASRRKVYHLYLYAGRDRQNLAQDAGLEKLAAQQNVKVTKILDNDGLRMMDKMSGGRPHNGCILETSPTPQVPLKSLGKLSEDSSKPSFEVELAYQSAEDAAINGTPETMSYQAIGNRKPFFLLLDGILDPGNLGAILRTAAFLGVTGVVISKHGSSGLTPVSLKASAGASEVLELYSVNSTPDFIERSKENGWMIYASVAAGPRSRGNSHLTIDRIETYDPLSEHPTILVIGSEGEGLEKKIKRLADFEVSIPGNTGFLSTIDSLNVSVATGIMCSAFLKKSQGFEIEEAMEEIKEKDGEESQLW